MSSSAVPRCLSWIGDCRGHLRLIDQTLLPGELALRDCRTVEELWEAIRALRVRGAPAIGVAAAYGVVIGLQSCLNESHPGQRAERLREVISYLATSRPTAVNLFWALERMEKTARQLLHLSATDWLAALLREAQKIEAEDRDMCLAIGRHGAALIQPDMGVLTHCNAGGLATAEYGTALAVFIVAAQEGKRFHVFADETRPLWQGARLTAWELQKHGIDFTLLCDSMAAQVMKEGRVQMVVTGADRIAANGDSANKIGTYGLAVLAKAHGIPFYIAAPSSTFDFKLASGAGIPIEQRDPREVTHPFGAAVAPEGIKVYNPAFDVTPADLIAGIITEKGIIQPVTAERIRTMLRGGLPVSM